MAFRSDDRDYRFPSAGRGRDDRPSQADREASDNSLSLGDTLRELAITIAGFVGVIVLITVAVKFLHG